MLSLIVLSSVIASAAQIQTYGKLEISADDLSFSMRVKGRIHMDGNFYETERDDTELPNGLFMRRARIGLEGNIHEYEYEVEVDFADDTTQLRDGYVRRLIGNGKLTIGQFKVFESLEKVSESNDLAFMERPYSTEITPGFKVGAAYNGVTGMFGYSGNVYDRRQASDGENRPINSGIGVVARGYVAPINERMTALHFGGSFAHEHSSTDGMMIDVIPAGRAQEYRNGDEFEFTIIERLSERVDMNRANFETAYINGPLAVQGEYMKGSADTNTRSADNFHAWYAQATYVLTGEWRRYKIGQGEIDSPEPTREIGAVEVGVRFQEAKREKVTNAVIKATDFGITYYANLNVRFMINYSMVNNKLTNDDPNLLAFRTQFNF